MAKDEPGPWMWAEACAMLSRAERLQRHFFEPLHPSAGSRLPAWYPPADVLETEREVLIILALPGVAAGAFEAAIEDGVLRVTGQRLPPPELRTAAIHRLELPQGRFERRIPLPPGRYSTPVRHALEDGCLVVRLDKAA